MNDQDVTAVLERVIGPLEEEMGSWDDVLRRAAEPRPENWDDVLDRAGARSGAPTRPPSRWRVVAIAVAIVAGSVLLATPALGLGDRLLSLIQGKRPRSTCRLLPGRATGGRSCS